MAAADRLVLSKEGLKHGRHLGRFSFEAIESKATSREITLICDTGVINRNNSPGQPLFYTANDICVFKARERRPCMWFTLPAKTFFTEFQPWFARVKGAALAHEYDEPEDSDEDFVSNGDDSSDEQGDAEVLTLSEPGVKHGNLRGRFPFSKIIYRPSTGKLTLGCAITEENKHNTSYEAEFYTSHEPVTVYSYRGGRTSAWFTLAADTFFDEFQVWWDGIDGLPLPDKESYSQHEEEGERGIHHASVKADLAHESVQFLAGTSVKACGPLAAPMTMQETATLSA